MTAKLIISLCLFGVTLAENFQHTIVVIKKPTKPTQTVFLRGGDAAGNGIPIRYSLVSPGTSPSFEKATVGDRKLDWKGREYGQTDTAQGTPMRRLVKHPNDYLSVHIEGEGFFSVKTVDAGLWVAEFEMDCDKTTDGWFEYKGFLADQGFPRLKGGLRHDGWEQVLGPYLCSGEAFPHGETFQTGFGWAAFKNHFGKCGHFNYVSWSKAVSCIIHRMDKQSPALPIILTASPIPLIPLGSRRKRNIN